METVVSIPYILSVAAPVGLLTVLAVAIVLIPIILEIYKD